MLNVASSGTRFLALFGIAMAATCFPPLTHPSFAGDWISESRTGCRVWNPNPTAKESVSWSGSCKDGFAEGAGEVQWFRNGLPYERDEGEWRRGRQVGHGLQVWPTGRYEGDVRDGVPHGRGVLSFGEARYEGEFSDGKPNGAGTLRSAKGVLQGTWKRGCFRDGKHKASIGVDLSSCP
jgi:hypothetical protein